MRNIGKLKPEKVESEIGHSSMQHASCADPVIFLVDWLGRGGGGLRLHALTTRPLYCPFEQIR